MTTGAVLYAFDGELAYTKFAIACAERIQKHLQIPITLVTDADLDNSVFEKIVQVESKTSNNRRWWADTDTSTSWRNHSRSRALELTPYDRTLLLDVDYIVNTDQLSCVLNHSGHFFAHKHVRSIQLPETRQQTFGTKNTDLWWATAVVFDRSEFCKDVFQIWQMVESNYKYYADFFGFEARQFRNDYALSIALIVANGGVSPDHCDIPWPLQNVDPEVAVQRVQEDFDIYYSTVEKGQPKHKRIKVKDLDLHIMGKSYLEQVYAL